MFRLFSKKNIGEDWAIVFTTKDSWEAELVRSALLNEDIQANIKITKGSRKDRQNAVYVPASKMSEAKMVLQRTSAVIARKDEIIAEQEELASKKESEIQAEQGIVVIPEIGPTSEPTLIAEKDGVGKIFYYEKEDVYELKLEFEFYKHSHFMSAEDWEEFIDFSAQRQEFFILLKEKYPKLAALVKEQKKRPQLLKLLEYSYGKSQPPRRMQEG